MDLLNLSKVAQAYYEGLRALSLAQGWEKYVVTDGTTYVRQLWLRATAWRSSVLSRSEKSPHHV